MRKYLCVLMSLILSLTVLCACSRGNANGETYSSNTVASSSEQISESGESTSTIIAKQSTTAKPTVEKNKKETTKKGEKASTSSKSSKNKNDKKDGTTKKPGAKSKSDKTSVSKKDNKKTTAAAKSTTKAQIKKSNSESNSKAEKSSSVLTTKSKASNTAAASKSEHKVNQSTSSTINCSITIECKSILDNMDDLKKGHESYVPKNGIMLAEYKTTLNSKSTVYDLLKKACKANSLTYTAKTTTYSIYIVGINNIDEFDCGKQSGWMYKVNGEYPNVSVDSKRLKDGDKVVFTYTCSYKK